MHTTTLLCVAFDTGKLTTGTLRWANATLWRPSRRMISTPTTHWNRSKTRDRAGLLAGSNASAGRTEPF
eukprot:2789212-Lingulodinium_polyedra.AAC.1